LTNELLSTISTSRAMPQGMAVIWAVCTFLEIILITTVVLTNSDLNDYRPEIDSISFAPQCHIIGGVKLVD
jgi:hypothetical protein